MTKQRQLLGSLNADGSMLEMLLEPSPEGWAGWAPSLLPLALWGTGSARSRQKDHGFAKVLAPRKSLPLQLWVPCALVNRNSHP